MTDTTTPPEPPNPPTFAVKPVRKPQKQAVQRNVEPPKHVAKHHLRDAGE